MPQHISSILLTGSELLDGRVQDTNGAFLAQHLGQIGFEVRNILSCGDDIEQICSALKYLCNEAQLVIISGGLGPTSDDLTRESLAKFLGKRLVLNEQVLEALKERYRKRSRNFDASNSKQALFPEGSNVIPNAIGTAAGCLAQIEVSGNTKTLISLPAVPHELRAMFEAQVVNALASNFPDLSSRATKLLRVFGLPEADVGTRVDGCQLKNIYISYRATFPEIHVTLKSLIADNSDLTNALETARNAIGSDYVFSESAEIDFEQVIQNLCIKHGVKLALAESCTGGMLGTLLTNIPGSSKFFLGGVVAYSNELKHHLLGVPQQVIEQHGAVSFQVANAMAAGIRNTTNSDLGLSVTGVAGPQGGTSEKPVGTFFVSLSDKQETLTWRCFFSGQRAFIRKYSTYVALDIVRRRLSNLPIPHGKLS